MQNNLSQQVERLTIGESSEYLGVSIDTLRRWEKKGVISAVRSPGGHRYFIKKDLDKLFGQKYTRVIPKVEEKPIPTVTTEKPPATTTQATTILVPGTMKSQPPQSSFQTPIQNIPEDQSIPQISQQPTKVKKDISWTTIIIIALILFTVVDLVLLLIYLTSSQPLVKPVP